MTYLESLIKKLEDGYKYLTDRFSGPAEHEIADNIRQAIEELSKKDYGSRGTVSTAEPDMEEAQEVQDDV